MAEDNSSDSSSDSSSDRISDSIMDYILTKNDTDESMVRYMEKLLNPDFLSDGINPASKRDLLDGDIIIVYPTEERDLASILAIAVNDRNLDPMDLQIVGLISPKHPPRDTIDEYMDRKVVFDDEFPIDTTLLLTRLATLKNINSNNIVLSEYYIQKTSIKAKRENVGFVVSGTAGFVSNKSRKIDPAMPPATSQINSEDTDTIDKTLPEWIIKKTPTMVTIST